MATGENKLTSTGTYINDQYYSGTQSSIFIGSIWLDDIISVNYQVQHNRRPVFGYGSQHFDLVPKGTILVSGNFTINFREPNYLWLILEHWSRFNQSPSLTKTKEPEKEDLIKEAAKQLSFRGDKRQAYSNFFGNKDPATGKLIAEKSLQKQGKIFAQNKIKDRTSNFNHPTFDITIGYGHDLNKNSIGEKIKQIHIMGKGKTIMSDGKPIQEQYQFIARDIS